MMKSAIRFAQGKLQKAMIVVTEPAYNKTLIVYRD